MESLNNHLIYNLALYPFMCECLGRPPEKEEIDRPDNKSLTILIDIAYEKHWYFELRNSDDVILFRANLNLSKYYITLPFIPILIFGQIDSITKNDIIMQLIKQVVLQEVEVQKILPNLNKFFQN